jgi:hypothetical protein
MFCIRSLPSSQRRWLACSGHRRHRPEDPGPAAYKEAMVGKRIIMVPMAMGFDPHAGPISSTRR